MMSQLSLPEPPGRKASPLKQRYFLPLGVMLYRGANNSFNPILLNCTWLPYDAKAQSPFTKPN